MRGRIFNCHHQVPARVQSDLLFQSMVAGLPGDTALGLLGDLDGRNISRVNRHSEMRHQFHVLHDHLDGLDYVGFEHYRRIFFVQPLRATELGRFDAALLATARRFVADQGHVGEILPPGGFARYLDLRAICAGAMKACVDRLMERFDVVTQRLHGERIDEHWRRCHDPAHWELLVEAVRRTGLFRRGAALLDFEMRGVAWCSMHVMRSAAFRDYMAFWAECMAFLEPRIEETERYLGYFSERLLNLWLQARRLETPDFGIGTLPFVIDGG